MFQFIYFPLLLMVIHVASICMSIPYSPSRSNEFSEKRKIAFCIVDELAGKYEKSYGLQFCGISEAAPEGKYQNLGMDFYIYKKLSKAEGRKILLELEHDFLQKINSNKQMEKYLLHPPFDGNNIVINIFSRTTDEPDLFYPDYQRFPLSIF